MFNITVAVMLLPFTVYPINLALPYGNYTVTPHLPPYCTPNAPFVASGSAVIICKNPTNRTVEVRGYVLVEGSPPPPPPPAPGGLPPAVVALAVASTAGAASYVATNRREWITVALGPLAKKLGALGALGLPAIGRVKRAVADDPVRRQIIAAVEKMGAATLSQIAKAVGKSWGAVQWHVYVLEREGKLKSIKVGPFTYYFVNARAAAEVILSSVDPSSLSLEDREKLDLMAS